MWPDVGFPATTKPGGDSGCYFAPQSEAFRLAGRRCDPCRSVARRQVLAMDRVGIEPTSRTFPLGGLTCGVTVPAQEVCVQVVHLPCRSKCPRCAHQNALCSHRHTCMFPVPSGVMAQNLLRMTALGTGVVFGMQQNTNHRLGYVVRTSPCATAVPTCLASGSHSLFIHTNWTTKIRKRPVFKQ